MLLSYRYQGNDYRIYVQWTSENGTSIVFRALTQKLADHGCSVANTYLDLAEYLDLLADKLYQQIYSFIDEHAGVPYDPRFRRIIRKTLEEITKSAEECGDKILLGLYSDVTKKLSEMVAVYLSDNAYQGKHRYRRQNYEQYSETTPEWQMACEFEDTLLQWLDCSRMLDCLTPKQRERFVRHVFLNFTMREIAEMEHTTSQAVQKSIAAAVLKLKWNPFA